MADAAYQKDVYGVNVFRQALQIAAQFYAIQHDVEMQNYAMNVIEGRMAKLKKEMKAQVLILTSA
jgi:hypothetical protein